MDERSRRILQAIVDDYVETCEPVGSKALVERHRLNLSSATVRNVMAELEEQGYIQKSHVSAGRTPSDKGYRAYVDNMLTVPDIEPEKKEAVRDYLSERINEATELIERAADYLSEETDFVSVALAPRYGAASLEQVKILMIEPGRALVVVVLSAGLVKDKLIRVPDMLGPEHLSRIAKALETSLKGKTVDDITLVTVSAATEGTEVPESLLNQVAYEAYVAIKQTEDLDVYIDGTHRLLKQPEFQDMDSVQRFFTVLKEPTMVAGYMQDVQQNETARLEAPAATEDESAPEGERLEPIADHPPVPARPAYMIRIGQEITLEGLEDMSFISTVYRLDDHVTGQIGVIGPKRMRYGEIISQISFVNRALTEAVRRDRDKRER